MRAIPQPKTHDDVALLEILSDEYSGIEVPGSAVGSTIPVPAAAWGKLAAEARAHSGVSTGSEPTCI